MNTIEAIKNWDTDGKRAIREKMTLAYGNSTSNVIAHKEDIALAAKLLNTLDISKYPNLNVYIRNTGIISFIWYNDKGLPFLDLKIYLGRMSLNVHINNTDSLEVLSTIVDNLNTKREDI